MDNRTAEFMARGANLREEHILAEIRRMQARSCETCHGTGYMPRGWLIHVPDANKTLKVRVECPFGCEEG